MERLNRLYVIRHGQVKGFETQPVYGHTDVDITEVGRLQMERIAERLRYDDIRAIYSSDLKRSIKGAQIIGKYHDVKICSLAELKEIDFGEWEGMTFTDVIKRFPGELDKRMTNPVVFQSPGGESIKEVSERVMSCVRRIMAENRGKDILIVAHGVVNRVILCDALGMDLRNMFNMHQDYGCLNIIEYYPDSTKVKLING